jgi:hypothetical protein
MGLVDKVKNPSGLKCEKWSTKETGQNPVSEFQLAGIIFNALHQPVSCTISKS